LEQNPGLKTGAKRALEKLLSIKDEIELLTYHGEMGENVAIKCGFESKVIGKPANARTTPEDIKRATKEMVEIS